MAVLEKGKANEEYRESVQLELGVSIFSSFLSWYSKNICPHCIPISSTQGTTVSVSMATFGDAVGIYFLTGKTWYNSFFLSLSLSLNTDLYTGIYMYLYMYIYIYVYIYIYNILWYSHDMIKSPGNPWVGRVGVHVQQIWDSTPLVPDVGSATADYVPSGKPT